jgi:hypothetical protein
MQLIGYGRGGSGDRIVMQTVFNTTWPPPNADWPDGSTRKIIQLCLAFIRFFDRETKQLPNG